MQRAIGELSRHSSGRHKDQQAFGRLGRLDFKPPE
jgi:hypothetical protein